MPGNQQGSRAVLTSVRESGYALEASTRQQPSTFALNEGHHLGRLTQPIQRPCKSRALVKAGRRIDCSLVLIKPQCGSAQHTPTVCQAKIQQARCSALRHQIKEPAGAASCRKKPCHLYT